MEAVYIIAILAAFVLGAHVRMPFSFAEKHEEEKKLESSEPTEEQKKAAWWANAQRENMLNAGNPEYKQKTLEDYE